MQALLLEDSLSYRSDLPTPEVRSGEALIKPLLAGICATDLELVRGYAGFKGIPGHEFVGRVEAVADDRDRHWLGRRVVGSINIGCGRCLVCLEQGPEHCGRRRVLGIRNQDGVFADYFTLPVQNLYAVPDCIADEAAVFTEPLAAACRVVEQIRHLHEPRCAVLGPGRLGMLVGKVLALSGYGVTVLGRTASSLALPAAWGLNCGLANAMPDNAFDCVVDASGRSAGFEEALRLVRARGALILKSTFVAAAPVDLTKVVVAEVAIIGSRCGPFAEALKLLENHSVPVETMIDGYYRLQDGLAAFEQAARGGVRKILLKP
ncbi:MAG: alcohol dehydrogenase catalytic domain-containing protein [Gammaproteobacteria bacterium]